METKSEYEIVELLRKLTSEKRNIAYRFIEMLDDSGDQSASFETMLMTEQVLSEDWDSPEEDRAWKDL